MILAIDAGNSRIKWGCFRDGEWVSTGAGGLDEFALLANAWAVMAMPDTIVISNVAGDRVRRDICRVLARFPTPLQWITAEPERCGVTNGYAEPAKLGSDRWAALIAAHRLQRGAVVVVNAGTALTVDALTANGEFLGGLIVPGIELMMRALTTGTAHAHAQHGRYAAFPVNTRDAIYSGAINAAVGSIERIATLLSARAGSAPNCIISGGAATLLVPHLGAKVVEIEHLVLDGLVAVAEATK
jgi:type III pantothenate kinase